MRPTLLVAALVAMLFAGCGVTVGPREPPEVTFYHLDLPDPLPAGTRLDLDLVVMPFSQAVALDRDGIRYRTSDVEGGYWKNQRWAEPVESMVRGAVERDLDRSGMFRRVLLLDQAGYAHAVLTGDVLRCDEEDRGDGWYAVLEIDFDVVRMAEPGAAAGTEDRVVLSRRYRGEMRAADQTAPEVVRALSRALSAVLVDLRRDLATAVVGEPER